MGSKLLELTDALRNRRQFGIDSDFDHFVTGDQWTSIEGDSGATVAVGDTVGGIALLTTGGTDNNEVYLHGTNEIFLFANDKAILYETELSYTEANTDDANVIAGFMDGVAANALQDDGAGPKSSYSGAVFFKADGDTVWSVESSLAGSQVTTQLTAANSLDGVAKTPGGGIRQTLRIEVQPLTTTLADVKFFIGVLNTSDEVLVAKHSLTYTSATEMQPLAGAKAGDTNSEVISVDRMHMHQIR